MKNNPLPRRGFRFMSILCVALLTQLFLLSACNKTCHCYGYDGSHKYYSPEEVEAEGTTCANMAYTFYSDGRNFYTLCEWDY